MYSVHGAPLLVIAMRFSARTAEHLAARAELMSNRKLRLVLECARLLAEILRLAVVLLNMAINYKRRHPPIYASEVAQ